jgi:hypothetical protein
MVKKKEWGIYTAQIRGSTERFRVVKTVKWRLNILL